MLFHKTQGCSPWDSALKNSAPNPHPSAVIAELSQAVANNTINHKKLIPNEKKSFRALQGKTHSMNNEALQSRVDWKHTVTAPSAGAG